MRWIQNAAPGLSIIYPGFSRGSVLRLPGGGPDLGYWTAVVTLNVGARTVGAYLPGHGKEAWGLDALYGDRRFDPLDHVCEPQMRDGQLAVWLLRWPGDGGSPRDLALLETGWVVVP